MSDLLKQAIADAKAVRATALANAKAALEEAFAPKLQSMLATKLQQEVEAEETDELPEEPAVAPVDAGVTDDVAVDGAPAPDAGLDAAPTPDAGLAPDAACEPAPDVTPVDAAPAPEGDAAPAPEGDEEFPIDERGTAASLVGTASEEAFDLTEEKASSNYKATPKHGGPVKDMKNKAPKTQDPQGPSKERTDGPGKADKQETKGEPKGGSKENKASPDYKKDTAGHKTQDPQGASNERSAGPGKADKNNTGKVLEEDDISEETLDEILKELEAEVATEAAPAPAAAPAMEEEIDLSSLLESDEKEEKEEKDDDDKDEDKEDNKPEWLKENTSLKKELEEYRNTVQYLRDRLNEINLLNAKLLYTNKLFKQAQLTNEQKLKVIEQFDLTKSVREAKLTYANLAESLSFGAKTSASAPVAKKTGMVKTITEGLASKPVASTKPTKTEVLTEGAEMANRFKKLAGIRK